MDYMLHYPYLISLSSKFTSTFIPKLPKDEGHTMVMTCIDRLSKIVQLIPLQEADTCTIADKFLSIVVIQHGLLEYIMIGHYPQFHGQFRDELMSLLDMTLTFSTVSHP